MYDLIIIGMGLSGISAAIYAKEAGLSVLMLDGSAPGGTLNKISTISNYPGIKEISGPDFAMNLLEEVNEYQIPYKLEEVTDVILEKIKTIKTKNNVYQSKYLLIATGRIPKPLGLKNEEKLVGRGISTCALCDGHFYKGKDIAVVGGGESALSESIYLAKLAHKVYVIHRRNSFRGKEDTISKVKNIPNIELILNDEIVELKTVEEKLTKVKLKSGKELNVEGLFIYIGSTPNTNFLKNTNLKMEDGYILINAKQETNIAGVYASGDVTKKEIYQLITAASEGATASIHINEANSQKSN